MFGNVTLITAKMLKRGTNMWILTMTRVKNEVTSVCWAQAICSHVCLKTQTEKFAYFDTMLHLADPSVWVQWRHPRITLGETTDPLSEAADCEVGGACRCFLFNTWKAHGGQTVHEPVYCLACESMGGFRLRHPCVKTCLGQHCVEVCVDHLCLHSKLLKPNKTFTPWGADMHVQ